DDDLEAAVIRQPYAVQEDTIGGAALEQAGHELAGQRLDSEERHEQTAFQRRLRIGGDADGTAATHFADDADDAFAGRGRHLVAQLGTLALQQLVHRLLLRRAV